MQISIADSCKCGNGPVDACYVASPQWFIPEVRQHGPQPGLWFLALWMPCRKQVVRTGRTVTNENCHLHHSCNYQDYLNYLHYNSMWLLKVSIIIKQKREPPPINMPWTYTDSHYLFDATSQDIIPFLQVLLFQYPLLSWHLIWDSIGVLTCLETSHQIPWLYYSDFLICLKPFT